MDYHQFIGQVQHRARLATFEDAVAATRATLQTLGERLYGGEPSNLASQLPREIGLYLTDPSIPKESFDLETFFERVAMREGTDVLEAMFHAREVLDVLDEAVSPGLIHHVCAQLPTDYDRLFKTCAAGEGLTAEHHEYEGESRLEEGRSYQPGIQGQQAERQSDQTEGEASRLAQEDFFPKDFPLQE